MVDVQRKSTGCKHSEDSWTDEQQADRKNTKTGRKQRPTHEEWAFKIKQDIIPVKPQTVTSQLPLWVRVTSPLTSLCSSSLVPSSFFFLCGVAPPLLVSDSSWSEGNKMISNELIMSSCSGLMYWSLITVIRCSSPPAEGYLVKWRLMWGAAVEVDECSPPGGGATVTFRLKVNSWTPAAEHRTETQTLEDKLMKLFVIVRTSGSVSTNTAGKCPFGSIEISDFIDTSWKITSDVIFINVKHSVEQGSLAWQAQQC